MYEVTGIGNAIVDILANVNDDFLLSHNLDKSVMYLTETDKQQLILKDLNDIKIVSGGSVGNTIATLSQLGVSSAFLGQTSNDTWGKSFEKDMEDIGVFTSLNVIEDNTLASGTSVILITPDGERTMNTNLGVSSLIDSQSIDEKVLTNSEILYIEGYLFDTNDSKNAIRRSINLSKSNNTKIALSLSDAFCVERHHDDFLELLKDVDILFANEAEICSLLRIPNQELTTEEIENVKNQLPAICAITQSDRGAIVISKEEVFSVDTTPIFSPQDLTGAGDQFAAGFIFGLVNDWSHNDCAKYGIELASRIIARIGSRFEKKELN